MIYFTQKHTQANIARSEQKDSFVQMKSINQSMQTKKT